jgi:hypothetical protein
MKADCVLRGGTDVATKHFLFLRMQIILNSENFLWSWLFSRDKWVPITTAWRVLGLRMEEPPTIWRVVANILNKQLRSADKGWSSSLGVGRSANNSSP